MKKTQKQIKARENYLRLIQREREIGIDPIYLNLPRLKREALRPAWFEAAKQWNKDHVVAA